MTFESDHFKLYDFFVDKYKSFDKKFKENDDNKKDVLLCFGISRAGKSTFLSRLLYDGNCDSFLSLLPTENGQRTIIKGVEIGKGFQSTTIIPELHKIKKFKIYDMPG